MQESGKIKFMRRIFFIVILVVIGIIVCCYIYNLKSKDIKNTSSNETRASVNDNTKGSEAIDSSKINNESKENLGYISKPYDGYDSSQILKGQNIIKSAESYAVPANEVAQILANHSNLKTKEVFLIFDDGPSSNTGSILKILKENDVHATFFVIGDQVKNNEEAQQLVRAEIEQGNAIGNHSFTHEYKNLFPNNVLNVSNVMNELNETDTLLQHVLGSNFNTRILRLPGGYMSRTYYKDPNLESFNKALDDECITSIDWDKETGDATTGGQLAIDTLVNNVMNKIDNFNQPVILMHDSEAKKDTVYALPYLIKALKEKGYKFMVIENAPTSSFKNISYATTTGSNQGQGTLN